MDSPVVPHVVVVDPRFDAYKELAESARGGRIILHLRSSGAEAIKIARRRQVDAWLIAAELDDMSGPDLVELLRSRAAEAKVAVVEAEGPCGRLEAAAQEATAVGAAVLSQPISLRDLNVLLSMSVEERSNVFAATGAARAFVTLPVGVSAAAISIAILLLN